MSLGGDENAVGIFRVDEDGGDLLRVAQVLQMCPRFPRVGGFVDAVTGRKIRALQSFAAADIDDVRIGRGNGQRADGASRLIVERSEEHTSELQSQSNLV